MAHKFGERGYDQLQQFHHCGIIYYPQRPYILCVMTQGTNQIEQIEVVSQISRAVLDQVKKDTN